MRRAISVAVMLLALHMHAVARAEQTYRIVVPFPAGGAMDRIARVIATELAASSSARVIVENRPGGDGLIAIDHVLQGGDRAASLLMVNPLYTTSLAKGRLPPEKAARLRPAVLLGQIDIHLIASTRSGIRTIADVLPEGLASGRHLSCAGAGGQFGTICDRLAADYPGRFTAVPYKGEAQAVQDLLAGNVDLMPITRMSAEPLVGAGKAALVADLSRPAWAGAAGAGGGTDLPIVFGTPITSFMGLMLAADVPAEIARALTEEIGRIVGSPRFAAEVAATGIRPVGAGPDVFERFLRENVVTQTRLLSGSDRRP